MPFKKATLIKGKIFKDFSWTSMMESFYSDILTQPSLITVIWKGLHNMHENVFKKLRIDGTAKNRAPC